jgi:antitoxin YefM
MQTVNYSTARNNLKSIMKEVCQNHDEYIVNDKDGANIVILSLEDYSALRETAYLLSSPANAKRLFESIESFKQGGGAEKKLADI